VCLDKIVFLAGAELRAACCVIANRSVLPLRLTELAITRALSVMAGLADAQIALAINQLNRQAATTFSNLDIVRIILPWSGWLSVSKRKCDEYQCANNYRRQPQAKNLDYNLIVHGFLLSQTAWFGGLIAYLRPLGTNARSCLRVCRRQFIRIGGCG
jgi:hypothetical protein